MDASALLNLDVNKYFCKELYVNNKALKSIAPFKSGMSQNHCGVFKVHKNVSFKGYFRISIASLMYLAEKFHT